MPVAPVPPWAPGTPVAPVKGIYITDLKDKDVTYLKNEQRYHHVEHVNNKQGKHVLIYS